MRDAARELSVVALDARANGDVDVARSGRQDVTRDDTAHVAYGLSRRPLSAV